MAYPCTSEKWTIGYGFNLQAPGASSILTEVGLNWDNYLKKGKDGKYVPNKAMT